MAISASNTGGAWDNAKKYISKGAMDALIGKLEPEVILHIYLYVYACMCGFVLGLFSLGFV